MVLRSSNYVYEFTGMLEVRLRNIEPHTPYSKNENF